MAHPKPENHPLHVGRQAQHAAGLLLLLSSGSSCCTLHLQTSQLIICKALSISGLRGFNGHTLSFSLRARSGWCTRGCLSRWSRRFQRCSRRRTWTRARCRAGRSFRCRAGRSVRCRARRIVRCWQRRCKNSALKCNHPSDGRNVSGFLPLAPSGTLMVLHAIHTTRFVTCDVLQKYAYFLITVLTMLAVRLALTLNVDAEVGQQQR